MMDKKFYTSKGDVSAYGFGCGYCQTRKAGENEVQMWHEHETYHVRLLPPGGKWLEWKSFGRRELTKARSVFKTMGGPK